MADIPVQRSYQQILGSMIDAFCAEKGIRNLRAGSAILCALEASARSDMRANQDIFAMLASVDLDKARGLALDRIGQSEDAPRLFQRAATGKVTITDSRYTKISTKLSPAMPTPIAGSTKLYVQDALLFGSTGVLYIGRGTPNYEGPLTFTSCTNIGPYWEIQLSAPTTKFHSLSEVVLLGQGGNRQIAAGQVVSTPQAALSDSVNFALVKAVKLPDGEVEVTGVEVVCTQPGAIGNVPAGSIKAFANEPFTGAVVSNTLPFSNGRETEDDDTYRERIRTVRKTKAKAIVLAIKNSVLGLTAEDSSSTITSASIVKRSLTPTTLFIDDGTGYEETSSGVANEILADSAAGGENVFELQHRPVAKAAIISLNSAPFDISGGKTLDLKVGGVSYTHTFQDTDAINAKGASAYEASASINANSVLPFAARTAEGGTKLVLTARGDTNEDIEVTGGTAAAVFAFPGGRVYSVRLYKNDKLLTKDGSLARIVSQPFASWGTFTSPATIEVAVDRTPAVTYTIVNQAFIDAQTGFNGIGLNSLEAWASVLNNTIPGVTATAEGNTLVLTSNLGRNSNARVAVTGGTLVTSGMFAVSSSVGSSSDYVLARNTSTVELLQPLAVGDQLSIGTPYTRAFVQSPSLAPSTYNPLKVWVSVDGNEQVVAHGVTPATPVSLTLDSIHSWGYEQKISCTGAFSKVLPGDWLTLWDPVLPTTYFGTFKVGRVDPTGDWATIERTSFNTARVGHAVVALANANGLSKVLIVGGALNTTAGIQPVHLPPTDAPTVSQFTASCDLYDPAAATVLPTGKMATARAYCSATLLPNGKVLAAGGYNESGDTLDSTEVYDPATGEWTPGPSLNTARAAHEAILLGNGLVLLCGGWGATGAISSCELYDPLANTCTPTGSMVVKRVCHSLATLGDGTVFTHGGIDELGDPQATAEVYDPVAGTWASKAASHTAKSSVSLAYDASTDKVLAFGSTASRGDIWNYEVYDVVGDAWSIPANLGLPGSPAGVEAKLVVIGDGSVVCPNLIDYASGLRRSASWTDAGGWVNGVTDNLYSEAAEVTGSKAVVLTLNNVLTNKVLVVGGYDQINHRPTSAIEQFETAWSCPALADVSNALLTSRGISVTRTSALPVELDVTPAPTLYSCTMLEAAFNGLQPGMTAKTWHTTILRFNSNSYTGSIAVLGANQAAQALGLSNTPQTSGDSHMATATSSSELQGTPSFSSFRLYGHLVPAAGVDAFELGGSYTLDYNVFLRRAEQLSYRVDTLFPFTTVAYKSRLGHQKGELFSPLSADGTSIEIREALQRVLLPGELAVGLKPYAIGPEDEIAVQIDSDPSKRHVVKCGRTLSPATTSYGQQIEVLDAEANTSLLNSFGSSFDYSDCALYMKARSILFGGPLDDRRTVARFYRMGAEGEGVALCFDNPEALNQTTTYAGRKTLNGVVAERVLLPSGTARTNPLATGNRYLFDTNLGGTAYLYTGLDASSATRDGAGDVTLTLTLVGATTSHKFRTGDSVYVSTGNASFPDGIYSITGYDATHITYRNAGAVVGATPITGFVSINATETRLDSSGLVVDDFVRFSEASVTYRITAIARRALTMSMGYNISTPSLSGVQQASTSVAFWANPKKTAAQVMTEFGAMSPALRAKCPVTLTLIGAGTASLYKCTADELANSSSFYTLADGINWVASSSIAAGNVVLTLKKPVTGSLAANSDWQNEELKLVPVTALSIVTWLNTPAVSGLFNDASVEYATHKIQVTSNTVGSLGTVQVQGGSANAVVTSLLSPTTVRSSSIAGLRGGMWVKLENQFAMPKAGVIDSSTVLTSLTADGYLTLSNDVYSSTFAATDMVLSFERVGRFVAIRTPFVMPPFFVGVEGQMLRIAAPTAPSIYDQVSAANTGLYKIVRWEHRGQMGAEQDTFWIEAPNAVEEFAFAKVQILGVTSVMPGDKLHINTSKWGVANRGVWTVEDVGNGFTSSHVIKLSTAERTPVPATAGALGTEAPNVYFEQSAPETLYAQVTKIVPSFSDALVSELTFDVDTSSFGPQAGTILSVCDKLGFPTDIFAGHDGYRYNTGLVGEANKAVYGDPQDELTYPGEAAAGVQIDITTGFVRRIKVALVIRLQSGAARNDIASRVKSAVASVINKAGLGQSISIGDMIKAAQSVPGVVSVGWLSPSYSATSDLIRVQGHEKPMVLDLDQDVQVTFAGE